MADNTRKDPDDWKTGDEPATGDKVPQATRDEPKRSYDSSSVSPGLRMAGDGATALISDRVESPRLRMMPAA